MANRLQHALRMDPGITKHVGWSRPSPTGDVCIALFSTRRHVRRRVKFGKKGEDVSKELDQILTAEELEEVREKGFNADRLFGMRNYRVHESVTLLGYNLAGSDLMYLGDVYLITTRDKRQFVFFQSPDAGRIVMSPPHGYVVRQDHPSHGTSFVFRPFQEQKEDPFMLMHRVRYEENVSAREVELKAMEALGWVDWNFSKENKGCVFFDERYWKDIWGKLNVWLPKE